MTNPQAGPAIAELHIEGPTESHTEGMVEPPLAIYPSAVGPSQRKHKDPLDVSTKHPCLDLNDMASALLSPDLDPFMELAGLPDLGNPPGRHPPCTFPVPVTSSDAFISTTFHSHCASTVDEVLVPISTNTATYGLRTMLPTFDGVPIPISAASLRYGHCRPPNKAILGSRCPPTSNLVGDLNSIATVAAPVQP